MASLETPEESQYAWLSHLYHGRGIASNGDAVKVGLPLVEAMTVTLLQQPSWFLVVAALPSTTEPLWIAMVNAQHLL